MAVLASACSGSSSTLANGQPAPATPTVTPTAVPVLGGMKLATFPQSWDGMRALQVCEQWAQLRGEYVTRVRTDNTLQLQLWFSGDDWLTAFNANSGLKVDSAYMPHQHRPRHRHRPPRRGHFRRRGCSTPPARRATGGSAPLAPGPAVAGTPCLP